MWDDLITEMANNGFVISSMVMARMCYVWHKRYGKNWIYWIFLVGLVLIFVSVMIRVGGWSLALKFAPEGEIWHPGFLEWRWVPSVITSLGFTAGTVVIIGFIESAKKREMFAWAAMIVAASVGIGLL